jgi:predicted metalloprotease
MIFFHPLKVRIIRNVLSYGPFCCEKPQYIYFEPNVIVVNTVIGNLTKDNKKSDKTVVKIPYNIIMDDKNEKIRALELKMELTFIH